MITDEQKTRIKEIIGAGLVDGLGDPEPGRLCVEAAICLALGEPHGDTPSCVAVADRKFAIGINDARWSSPRARADALLPLALAQLGTAGTDRRAWVRRVVDGTIRRVVPMVLRAEASRQSEEQHRTALLGAAERCERDGSLDAAAHAANAANAVDAALAVSSAARAASDARSAADAPRDADYAARAASSAAYAARVVARAADDADRVLREAVAVAIDAYREEGRA